MVRLSLVVVGVVMTVHPTVATSQSRKARQRPTKLWAAMSVPQPVIPKNRVNDLTLSFAIVNDGDSTVNPSVAKSHLFINGVELKQWEFINTNGPHTTRDTALPPGKTLEFSCGCGQYFSKPSVYTLKWYGDGFKALDLTFRVLPGDL